MIVEEKLRKGAGFVAKRLNELGLKLGPKIHIHDWTADWCILYYDTEDVAQSSTPQHPPPLEPPHRGPGRPPNPPKEAA